MTTYRNAISYLTSYGKEAGAEAIRLHVEGRVAAEAIRKAAGAGDWEWVRGGWNWSE